VSGSRADYGLLYWVLKEIQDDPELELQLVATAAHLSPEFGLTYRQMVCDGFAIDAKVEMLLSSDTSVGVTKSIGLAIIGFGEVFERLCPDMLLLLGDRYEMLAAAQAALIAQIPVAHIAGGDVTEGAFDEAIRHSVTKMSHVHFVTNAVSAARVRQLGEDERYIFNVGSPGLDYIRRMELLALPVLEEQIAFQFRKHNLLITYHPETLSSNVDGDHFGELLHALHNLGAEWGLIFTKPNADTHGRVLAERLESFVMTHENARVYESLGSLKYLSVMAQVDAVVGNSSSGLYEAPSFSTPTVNIGDRQKGRLKAASVFDCSATAIDIEDAIAAAVGAERNNIVNPYGDGYSASRIKNHLKQIPDPRALLKKHFFDS